MAESSEPQWIGMLGSLLGDLRRRRRELPEAPGGRGRRARPPRALHRRRDADRPAERDRGAHRGRLRAAGARPARDAPGARGDRSRPPPRRPAARRGTGGRPGGARPGARPARPSWPGLAGATTPGCGSPPPRSGRRSSGPTRRRSRAGGRPRRRSSTGTGRRRPQSAPAALELARGLGSRWLVAELEALCERARLETAARTMAHAARTVSATDPGRAASRTRSA